MIVKIHILEMDILLSSSKEVKVICSISKRLLVVTVISNDVALILNMS